MMKNQRAIPGQTKRITAISRPGMNRKMSIAQQAVITPALTTDIPAGAIHMTMIMTAVMTTMTTIVVIGTEATIYLLKKETASGEPERRFYEKNLGNRWKESACWMKMKKRNTNCFWKADWLKAEAYVSCDGIAFKAQLAQKFYKHYKISLYENNHSNQFTSCP